MSVVDFHIISSTPHYSDVASINQFDKAEKKLGIANVRAAMQLSDSCAVILSQDYLTRLWCVFELAAFSDRQQTGSLSKNAIIYLSPLAPLLILAEQVLWIFIFAYQVRATPRGPQDARSIHAATFNSHLLCVAANVAFALPASIIPWLFIRRAEADQLAVNHLLKNFSVEGAGCALDSDRVVITEFLVSKFGSTETFERFVRKKVRMNVSQTLGSERVFTISMICQCAFPAFLAGMDIAGGIFSKYIGAVLTPLLYYCLSESWVKLVSRTEDRLLNSVPRDGCTRVIFRGGVAVAGVLGVAFCQVFPGTVTNLCIDQLDPGTVFGVFLVVTVQAVLLIGGHRNGDVWRWVLRAAGFG